MEEQIRTGILSFSICLLYSYVNFAVSIVMILFQLIVYREIDVEVEP